MHILISNDDGFRAPGLAALAAALEPVADECTVVAPDRDRSGASSSLTLDRPLHARRQENGFIAVQGTPTDCVHLAINGMLDRVPDMVVSGVNHGANMGDDVLYSGTVAAAIEGRFLGLPAIAVSLVGDRHFDTAARVARELVERLARDPLPPDTILNVNVPDRAWADIDCWSGTRLGNRHGSEPVLVDHDPRGRTCYWIGPPGPEQDAGEGTDFDAVAHGRVSVTPLNTDLTRFDTLPRLGEWMAVCSGA
jgi:5'-nucleotidase